jgi:hypothetical protein
MLKDGYDRGVRGQYNACHAEKQLVAYLVDRHVFLPQGLDKEDFEISNLSPAGSLSNGTRQGANALNKLREIQPPQRLEEAVILVSRKVCSDCSVFAGKGNTALNLRIELWGVEAAKQYA